MLCTGVIHTLAFSTYKVTGLLEDKILYREDVFSLVHVMNSSLLFQANKYQATLNNMLSPLGVTVPMKHTLYNSYWRALLFDCIAHIN